MNIPTYFHMNMRALKFFKGLLPQILLAMLLGVGAAFFFPLWAMRVFATFNAIFSQFLSFIIPLLILAFVAPAIADVGKGAGKMLGATAGVAYLFTIIAGLFSFGVSNTLFPHMIKPGATSAVLGSGAKDLLPYFTIEMPPLMNVISALIIAFILGLGCCALPSRTNPLRGVLNDLREIIAKVIAKIIIPFLPVYIFGIFLNITQSGEISPILSTFAKIILVIFAMHIAVLVFQFIIAALFSKTFKNPFKMLWTMLPAYFTALGTQSSAATIPVTLKQAHKLGVRKEIAGFTIPLCATIHLSGSTLKIVACAVALMITNGLHYTTGEFIYFIFMLAITMVAAPGVPGGAIMASLGILSSVLGFSEADNALMIALYITMDSFGTACNVTGDGAVSVIINRLFPFAAEAIEIEKELPDTDPIEEATEEQDEQENQ